MKRRSTIIVTHRTITRPTTANRSCLPASLQLRYIYTHIIPPTSNLQETTTSLWIEHCIFWIRLNVSTTTTTELRTACLSTAAPARRAKQWAVMLRHSRTQKVQVSNIEQLVWGIRTTESELPIYNTYIIYPTHHVGQYSKRWTSLIHMTPHAENVLTTYAHLYLHFYRYIW